MEIKELKGIMGAGNSKEEQERERDERQKERDEETRKRYAENEEESSRREQERRKERENELVLKEEAEAENRKLQLQIIKQKGILDKSNHKKRIEEKNIKLDITKEEGKQKDTELKAAEAKDQRKHDLKVLEIEDGKEERIAKGKIKALKEQNLHHREEIKNKLHFVYNIAKLSLVLIIVCILLVFADIKINEYYQHHEILYKWSLEYASGSKSAIAMQDSNVDPDILTISTHILDMNSDPVRRQQKPEQLRIETVNRNNRLEIENNNQKLEPRIIESGNSAVNKENKRLIINSERWARESDSEWETLSDELGSVNLGIRKELDSRNEEDKPIDQNEIKLEEDSEFETQTSDSYLSILFYWLLSTTLKTAVVTFLVSFLISKLLNQ